MATFLLFNNGMQMPDNQHAEHLTMVEAIDKAAESSLVKWVNKLVVPLLLTIVAFFGARSLSEIQTKQDKTDASLTAIAASAVSTQTDVRLLGARLDYSVVAQIQQMDRRIEKNEAEIRELSRKELQK